jgi:uncharacterized protein YfiM (DUF2279 family)
MGIRILIPYILLLTFCCEIKANPQPHQTAVLPIDRFTNLTGEDTIQTSSSDTLNSSDTSLINKPLLRNLSIGVGTLYAGSIFGLYHLWYKDYPQSSFHFFNDNDEWLQIDKVGHATSAYYISMIGYETMSLTGVNNKKSALIGGSLGLVYLTTVEIFDGFSAGWGASPGDVIANITGTAAFISQQLIWKEQRISFKWSYHPTEYAQYRPDLLGRNGIQRALKDYNGHTYWLSGNIKSFLTEESRFPSWLNIAAGYGASGMVGAFSNPPSYEETALPIYERKRHYYISPDIDLSKIKVNSKPVGFLLKALGFIKIPMPAVRFDNDGVKFYPLYF